MTVYIAHIPDYRMIKIGFTTQLEKRIKAIPGEVPGPRIYGKRTIASVLRTFEGDGVHHDPLCEWPGMVPAPDWQPHPPPYRRDRRAIRLRVACSVEPAILNV